MSVQSARVQKVVKGDDVVLRHQIMESVAYNAELSRAPVELATGDLVNFFYPLQDDTLTDLIGYPGVVVTAYPNSLFDVSIPGDVPAATPIPERGTKVMQAGLGRTVRAEVDKLKATTTGDTTLDDTSVVNVASVAGIKPGYLVKGAGIPDNTIVVFVGVSSVELSADASATAVGVALTFYQRLSYYLIQEVDIYERGFPNSLNDTSGGSGQPPADLNLP